MPSHQGYVRSSQDKYPRITPTSANCRVLRRQAKVDSMERIPAQEQSGREESCIDRDCHAPWIDGIRNTTLGGLVLGFGFLLSDLVCYLVGIAAGAFAELTMRRWREKRETNSIG